MFKALSFASSHTKSYFSLRLKGVPPLITAVIYPSEAPLKERSFCLSGGYEIVIGSGAFNSTVIVSLLSFHLSLPIHPLVSFTLIVYFPDERFSI